MAGGRHREDLPSPSAQPVFSIRDMDKLDLEDRVLEIVRAGVSLKPLKLFY